MKPSDFIYMVGPDGSGRAAYAYADPLRGHILWLKRFLTLIKALWHEL